MAELNDLIYDWGKHNVDGGQYFFTPKPRDGIIEIDDETLRDGRQSPTLGRDASREERLQILRLMEALGIQAVDLGLPGAGPHEVEVVEYLANAIRSEGMDIEPNCAARTIEADIRPIIEISQRAGIPIEVAAFLGCSRIRGYTEGWDLPKLLRTTEDAVKLAVDAGLPVMYVTEDTTRAQPKTVEALYRAAIDAGAKRICICDTAGAATPQGTYNLVRFVMSIIETHYKGEGIKVDWHGHQDRGLALANTIAAMNAGVDRVHSTANGMGERSGNLATELILDYLRQQGHWPHDVAQLAAYCAAARQAFEYDAQHSQPIVGRDAFRTGTGVHAAAIIKARAKGDTVSGGIPLEDAVYSGVPASVYGRKQGIDVGPMSGMSNAYYWADQLEVPDDQREAFATELFQAGKRSKGFLDHKVIEEMASRYKQVDTQMGG